MSITAPTDLPGLWFWYDADDSSSITTATGGISQWNDKSGVGNHLVQATSAQRPFVDTTSGPSGMDAVRNEAGNSDYLTRAASNMLSSTTLTVVALVHFERAGGGSRRFLALNQSGQADWNNAASVMFGGEGDAWPSGIRNSNSFPHGGTWVEDTYHIASFRFDGTNITLWNDTTQIGTEANSGTFDVDEMWLGTFPGGGDYAWMRVCELFGSSSSLTLSGSTGQLYDSWAYLDNKWGLGLGLGGSTPATLPSRPRRQLALTFR